MAALITFRVKSSHIANNAAMVLHTHHVCLHVHLNICVSVNAFRFMAARHKRRPDLYFILYVRPLHGFYARQLYVQIRFILSFSSTLNMPLLLFASPQEFKRVSRLTR